MTSQVIRWQQRSSNFERALKQIKNAAHLANKRTLSELEQQGLIQAFEYTHELAWKTLKDFLEFKGNQNIYGSKDVTREAFKLGLILKSIRSFFLAPEPWETLKMALTLIFL